MGKIIEKFEDLNLNKQLLNAVLDSGYSAPTPIQKKAIPLIKAGHDLLGIAQTGTGKTAAYVLPLLMKVKYPQGKNPRAVILAPTRELVLQINENIEALGQFTQIRHVCLYGGTGIKNQMASLEAGTDIVVTTPGRLIDIYQKGGIILKEVKTLILDEGDKMMDMGFAPQIRKLLEWLPLKRQNLLFSATMPDKVKGLAGEFLDMPQEVYITPQSTPKNTVKHWLYRVPNLKTKVNLLLHLLDDEENFTRVIVFVKTKDTANNIFKYLERKGAGSVRVIHANKGQNTRINAINAYKSGEIRILVATDVVARGIDISMVSHVINFDVPLVYEDYVHRIGRTGRVEHEGTAVSFVNEAEEYHIRKIEELINASIPEIPLPEEVTVVPTSFTEKQEMLREIDSQKKKENPDYGGAFHEKKRKNKGKNSVSGKQKSKKKRWDK